MSGLSGNYSPANGGGFFPRQRRGLIKRGGLPLRGKLTLVLKATKEKR